jgi:Rieske 2Fe-2S family protein
MKTLPRRYYADPSLYHREMEKFFCQSWVCAGRAEAIPNSGDYFLREVAGESLIVVRDGAGAVRAFYNVCRHRGTRLCSAVAGNFGARIQCPYHRWTYGLDGRLLGAPHMEGADFRREDYPLHEAHISVWDGHIFLNLSRKPKPLARQLADLPKKFAPWRMEELRLYKRVVYELRANWKLVVANYNECLHCLSVHPALNRLTDYLGADNETPQPTYIGGAMGFRNGAQTMSFTGEKRRAFLPGLDESERKKVCYYAIYPNLLLSLNPDYMMVHRLWPKSVDQTDVECEWYFHPAEIAKPGFDASDAIEFWDTVNREDWEMVERSQQGVESRAYTPGPYSKREDLLYAFDQTVRKKLSAKVHDRL